MLRSKQRERGGAASGGGGGFYPVALDQSLRFNDDDSAYLSRTPSVAGNRKTWTWSGWVKRGNINIDTNFMLEANSGSGFNRSYNYFSAANEIVVGDYTSAWQWQLKTSALFRDTSAWYHIVLSVDTTQATASNRIKLYVNGEQVTSFSTATYPSQNYDTYINSVMEHTIGYIGYAGQRYFDGYMAEVHFTDGTAYTADAFGEFKSGVWVAKTPSVTYGTNGFYLKFANSGALGTDSSGNGNTWTPTNLAATDVMLDSPTNNFATLNPIDINTKHTFSEGNLGAVLNASSNPRMTRGTCLVTSGKWYAEFTETVSTSVAAFGIVDNTASTDGTGIPLANSIIYFANGAVYRNGTNIATYATSTLGDVISVAMDLDGSTVEFFKNGVSLGAAISITTGNEYTFGAFANQIGDAFVANFGQDSSFAGYKTPQGNTDANGIGDFYYDPTAIGDGTYLALCTANLPEPAISPADGASPSDYMNTVLYTGTGTTRSVTGVGFQPDLIWTKSRSNPSNHGLVDVIRGTNKVVFTDSTDAEYTLSAIDSFDSDGFTTSSSGSYNNLSGWTYVAWNWKAGGTPVSNTDGTITSSVSANVDSGFSIVSYTGTGANATVGHGLTSAPEMVILKNRSITSEWRVYAASVCDGTNYLFLNSTSGLQAASTIWNNTIPTATTVSIGTHASVSGSGNNLVMYCFHSVEGFSKIGSYTGNGSSTDGPFVYLGFRPSFVLIKRTNSTGFWVMLDDERSAYNVTDDVLYANASNAESVAQATDFLSNGFKLRTTDSDVNASGTYIYMAFAEMPAKYSLGR